MRRIFSTLWLFLTLCAGASAESSIFFKRIPSDEPPQAVYFLNQKSGESPIFVRGEFLFKEHSIIAAAAAGRTFQDSDSSLCLVIETGSKVRMNCDNVRIYPSRVQGRDSSDVISEQSSKLTRETEGQLKRNAEMEGEIRMLRDSLGKKIDMEMLTTLRMKRLSSQEKTRSLKKEKATLEKALIALRDIKSDENSQFMERSLGNSLYDYQQLGIRKKR